MIAANTDPFCSRSTRRALGVLALKKATQLALIAAIAPAPLDGSEDPVAGAELVAGGVAGCVAGGELVPGLEPAVPPLLLQAVSVSPAANTNVADARLSSRSCRFRIGRVCRRNRLLPNVADDPIRGRRRGAAGAGRRRRPTGRSRPPGPPAGGADQAVHAAGSAGSWSRSTTGRASSRPACRPVPGKPRRRDAAPSSGRDRLAPQLARRPWPPRSAA